MRLRRGGDLPDCIAPDEHLEYLVEQPEGIFINPEDRYEEEEYDG